MRNAILWKTSKINLLKTIIFEGIRLQYVVHYLITFKLKV